MRDLNQVYGLGWREFELGDGRLRQNRLGELLGFDRSRLSHHLSRMEERGLAAQVRAAAGLGEDQLRAASERLAGPIPPTIA